MYLYCCFQCIYTSISLILSNVTSMFCYNGKKQSILFHCIFCFKSFYIVFREISSDLSILFQSLWLTVFLINIELNKVLLQTSFNIEVVVKPETSKYPILVNILNYKVPYDFPFLLVLSFASFVVFH